MIGKVLLNSKFPLDELLQIVRPVIYVFYINKFRAVSATFANRKALKISLIIDLIQFVVSNIRVYMSNKAEAALKLEQGKPGKS